MMKLLLSLLMLLTTHVFSATTPYPPLNATTLDKQQISSKEKVTYLKFWATWCAYCVEEMPLLEQSYQQANNGYQVISINIGFNQSLRGVTNYLKKYHYQFPTVFDSDGSITRQYQVLGTPQHILLDEHGNELYRSALFTDELADKLSKLQGSH
ncbi:TlpA family protein disulfide reductase [Pseudoalteromonas luteoviolacea]|uniref:TlpA family protein disulfide reductase n=1 Tax=Pseudoalteromonas luteoviolacea TaxID=43657 RepID=UPI001B362FBB|nr:TlpA disulfide reductase family protein [Pseudoalteromonas luteoviolacea]MBQ4839888.1 TlpA family protein disulfide reductase [Pseudoalteromonas luteoviolacea]